jgi:hypothetical protein
MKRLAAGILLFAAARAGAQDSSYTELRLRVSAFRNPVAGAISEDWKPGTGLQLEVGTPIALGELSLSIGTLGYAPLTGKPKFRATMFTLGWTRPIARVGRIDLSGGLRVSAYRMDFDDSTVVAGLRNEEETLIAVTGRGRVAIGRRSSLFIDGSFGVLMLGTRTRMALIHVGAERALTTPAWLLDVLR